MTTHQPATVQIAREDRVFGSKLTPEQRAQQIALLPAIIATLRAAADAANAAAGQTSR